MLIEHSAGRSLPTTHTLSPAPSPCLNRQPTRVDMCTDMCIDRCIDAHADISCACAARRRKALVETVERSAGTPVYTHGPCRRRRRRRTPPFLREQPLSGQVCFFCTSVFSLNLAACRSAGVPAETPVLHRIFLTPTLGHADGERRGLARLRRRASKQVLRGMRP